MCCFGYSTGFCSAERRKAGSRKHKRQVRKDNDKEKTQKRRSASDRQKASKAGNCIDNPGAAVTGPVSGTLYFVRAGRRQCRHMDRHLGCSPGSDQYLGLCPWDDQPEAGEYPPAVSVTWCDHQRIDGSYVSGDLYYWNGMICNYENNINTIKNDSVSLWGQDYFCILLR